MNHQNLEKYCEQAIGLGFADAKIIHPGSVMTAPWVRLKCQFGCPGYGKKYSCPPDTPTPEQMRSILDSYHRAILFHIQPPQAESHTWRKVRAKLLNGLTDLEGEMFKDGYYKAFLLTAGPCHLCKECAKLKEESCKFGHKARPSMEACGIDVYQTVRNSGFFVAPLREKTDARNDFCLMLAD